MRKEFSEHELDLGDAISKGAIVRRARKTLDSVLAPMMSMAKQDKEEKALEILNTTRNFYLTNLELALGDNSVMDVLQLLPDMATVLKTVEAATYQMMSTRDVDEKNYKVQLYAATMDKEMRENIAHEKTLSAYSRLIRSLLKKTGKAKGREYRENVKRVFRESEAMQKDLYRRT